MSTQAIDRPHGEPVPQLSGFFLQHFTPKLAVCWIGFEWSPTAGSGGQRFNPTLPPAVDPGVDRRDADRLHFCYLCRLVSQMKETNGHAPLAYFWTFIAPDGCLKILHFCFVELVISDFSNAPSSPCMTVS